MSATVWLDARVRSASIPVPVRALVTRTSVAAADAATSPSAASTRSALAVSDLLSTTVGWAPLSNASTNSRSRRRTFGPLVSDWTTNTSSMLAATTCSLRALPSMGSPRTNDDFRGSTSTISSSATSTQSPTAGEYAPGCANSVPPTPMTVARPKSTRATRAGRASGRWRAWAANVSFQPSRARAARFTGITKGYVDRARPPWWLAGTTRTRVASARW